MSDDKNNGEKALSLTNGAGKLGTHMPKNGNDISSLHPHKNHLKTEQRPKILYVLEENIKETIKTE